VALDFTLSFDPDEADHRRAADWLEAQPDPVEAVVRLIGIAEKGEQQLLQWEELATLLVNEVRGLRARLAGHELDDEFEPEIEEDPESAHRIDTIFG
jgi:hypothetical protein